MEPEPEGSMPVFYWKRRFCTCQSSFSINQNQP